MKKDGFISMSVVYTFIIIFVLLMLSLLTTLSMRNRLVTNQVDEVKVKLNKGYE